MDLDIYKKRKFIKLIFDLWKEEDVSLCLLISRILDWSSLKRTKDEKLLKKIREYQDK